MCYNKHNLKIFCCFIISIVVLKGEMIMFIEVCLFTEEEYESCSDKPPAVVVNTDFNIIKSILNANKDVKDYIEDDCGIHARMNIRNLRLYAVFRLKQSEQALH